MHYFFIDCKMLCYSTFQQWNDSLAKLAQEWAEKCDFHHPDKTKYPKYASLGQNLALDSAKPYDLEKQLRPWQSEVKSYTYSTSSCSAVCGHYTQVRPDFLISIY